jgi:SAM-dependent methyltransferase
LLGVPARFEVTTLFDTFGQYDAIWIEQAFHHVEPRAEAFAHLSALLKPGGQVVISDSNAWNPLNQAAAFKVRGLKTIKRKVDDVGRVHLYGDERITTPGALTAGFRSHGIHPVAQEYFGVLPNHPLAERLAAVEKMVPAFMVPAFTHYLWVGEKA